MSKSRNANSKHNKRHKKSPGKGKFTPEEDFRLRILVNKYGENWEIVSSEMQGRNVRQVRDRWNSYLSPTINSAPFSEEEDILLETKFEEFGPKWVFMLQFFNNRTDAALKNRWQYLERRHLKGIPITYETNEPQEDQESEETVKQDVKQRELPQIELPKPEPSFNFNLLSFNPPELIQFWPPTMDELSIEGKDTFLLPSFD